MNTINKKFNAIILALVFGLAFYGCSSNGDTSKQEEATGEHAGHNHETQQAEEGHTEALHAIKEELAENEVLLTGKQMEAAGIQLGKIKEQQLSKLVKAFGELVLAPSDEASVSALIGGIISDIRVMEGDFVRKDEVIARIVHPEIINMQQDYLETRYQDKYLKAEYLRQKKLLQDSVNAEKTVQNANAAYQSNLAKMQSLKKKLQLININPDRLTAENIVDGYALKSPISGYVAQMKINIGTHVTPQQSLFHITANEKTHIDLKLYEKDISKVKPGQKITFNLSNNPIIKPLEGEIMKMGKRFDTEQRTAVVHAAINKMTHDLLPGMSVVAFIQTGGKKQLTLPEAAFVSDDGKDYIFLLEREGTIDEPHTSENAHAHQEEEHETHAEETHEHHTNEGHDAHYENESNEEKHFYVFKKVQVRKEITQAGFCGFSADINSILTSEFAVNNAQAILSEMKKGGSGHDGHAH